MSLAERQQLFTKITTTNDSFNARERRILRNAKHTLGSVRGFRTGLIGINLKITQTEDITWQYIGESTHWEDMLEKYLNDFRISLSI